MLAMTDIMPALGEQNPGLGSRAYLFRPKVRQIP
jgi:hypothetical protein